MSAKYLNLFNSLYFGVPFYQPPLKASKTKNLMKLRLCITAILTLAFMKAGAQTHNCGIPWDVIYQMKDGDTQVVKGEKGKVIMIGNYRSRASKIVSRLPELILKKTDSKTGEKIEFKFIPTTELNYVLKEGDELDITANADMEVYFSGYKYGADQKVK